MARPQDFKFFHRHLSFESGQLEMFYLVVVLHCICDALFRAREAAYYDKRWGGILALNRALKEP